MASRTRIVFLFCGFIFLWSALLIRAGHLQIVHDPRLEKLKQKQFQTNLVLTPRRGAIVDRNGRDLALSVSSYSIFADPKLIEEKRTVAKQLASILKESSESVYSKIKGDKKRFVWIERQIDEERALKVKALDVRGLQVVEESKRVYPNENLMSSTLGFIGAEGQGLEGIELSYQDKLTGPAKKVNVKRDARGRPLLVDGQMLTEGTEGSELKLTVDSELQFMMENELIKAVKEFNADAAYGVILDAKTSAIRAIANAPTYDPNMAAKTSSGLRRNRVITDSFELGSTLKTFVIAGALREKILAPNTKYNTENGKFKVGDKFITEAETDHKWPQLTVSEILAYSSNIGTTKIAFDLGAETVRKIYEDFGFGAKSGVDLPGEAKGTILPLPWRPHLLANISFGQGVMTNPLQLANAYASIANGGKLMKPYIVESIRDAETGELKETKPQMIRQVLSQEDATAMRLMLAGVTTDGGTGVNARVEGFPVGGKTGTAQKAIEGKRGYAKGAYISSFAGFVPVQDPKFVMLIIVDYPKAKSYYGSQVAAPIFSRIASYAVRKEGLAPVLLSEKNLTKNENLKSKNPTTSEFMNNKAEPMKKLEPQQKVQANVVKASEMATWPEAAKVEMVPALHNLTLRSVLSKIRGQDIKVEFEGSGVVSETIPAAGQPLGESREVRVILK